MHAPIYRRAEVNNSPVMVSHNQVFNCVALFFTTVAGALLIIILRSCTGSLHTINDNFIIIFNNLFQINHGLKPPLREEFQCR